MLCNYDVCLSFFLSFVLSFFPSFLSSCLPPFLPSSFFLFYLSVCLLSFLSFFHLSVLIMTGMTNIMTIHAFITIIISSWFLVCLCDMM